jgi:hypothetical protein
VEGLIILAVIILALYKLVKMVAAKLYPSSDVMRAQAKWGAAGKDAWGHYPKEEEHVGLFEQIRREQEERNRSASNATTFYNSKEWRRLRYQAFRKYGNKCSVCGRGASEGMVIHVDHIKPRSLHPHLALELSNLQIMCHECNVSKSNRDEIKWR